MKPVTLLGMGTAIPPGRIDQSVAAAFGDRRCCATAEQSAWLRRRYERSGVARRGSVLVRDDGSLDPLEAFYPEPSRHNALGPTTQQRLQQFERSAPPLAQRAAAAAMRDADVKPAQIDRIVTASCTGLMSPGVDMKLIEGLGLCPTVGRTNLGFMGCHAAFNALQVAHSLALSEPGAKVLIVCVELCTLHFHYGWDKEKIVANALFGDGAAAVVVEANESRRGLRLHAMASHLLPDCPEEMTWRIGDHGFMMTLSPLVPRLIKPHVTGWLTDWLAEQGVSRQEVASWALHPGGPKILDTVSAALDLDDDAAAISRLVLAECGNMSSTTILFILERLRRAARGGTCVAMGFGPGLVMETALLEMPNAE